MSYAPEVQAGTVDTAASLAAIAKEIAGMAKAYQRLSTQRDSLASSLEVLMDALNYNYQVFLRKRSEEAPNAS